ncbi:MAG: hypothetical protein JSV03_13400 [Planctomycetota bacterium]|nr:MAG: hypothetical protein JSV03_13400 [Planctomycetota bacterium]
MPASESDELNWLAGWKNASARMDQLRKIELACVDVAHAIEILDDAYESARQQIEPVKYSGLVIQQAFFTKGRQE